MRLDEFVKHPIANLLSLFNLRRIGMTPAPPVIRKPYGPYDHETAPGSPQVRQKDEQFQRPTMTLADSIKRRGRLTRVEKYAVYEEMDRDPMVGEMLDAYAEAITTLNTEEGVVVWAVAENQEIADQVNDLFAQAGVQSGAFACVRSMLKYGDVFDGIVYTEKSNGVVTLNPYEPWRVARIQDIYHRLSGFAPAQGDGRPSKIDSEAVPPYDILHTHLLSKERDTQYGTALFDSGYENWEDVQQMLDSVVLNRILRRPDRLMVLLDTTGLGFQEGFEAVKIWEKYLYKEVNVDTGNRVFQSRAVPMTENRDLILPKGPNNATEIRNFPSTRGNDQLRDLQLMLGRFAASAGFPAGYFGYEGGTYRSDQSLAKQDPRFAKRAMRGQFAYLQSLAHLGMIHLALRGLDPLRKANRFEVHGMPISTYMEIEYNELLQMRWDLVDRVGRGGRDLALNEDEWRRYVLKKFARLPDDIIDRLTAKAQAEAAGRPVKPDAVLDEEARKAIEENRDVFEGLEAAELSRKASRVKATPTRSLTQENLARFEQDKKREWEDEIFERAPGGAIFRAEQERRAMERLERLKNMATNIG
jgi:hypothetical protein